VLHEEFVRWSGNDTAGRRQAYEAPARQVWPALLEFRRGACSGVPVTPSGRAPLAWIVSELRVASHPSLSIAGEGSPNTGELASLTGGGVHRSGEAAKVGQSSPPQSATLFTPRASQRMRYGATADPFPQAVLDASRLALS
jgi:hypothetical protein